MAENGTYPPELTCPCYVSARCCAYRIYSNKCRGAYLFFRVSGAALIRGRRLFEGGAYSVLSLVPQRQNILIVQIHLLHEYFRCQELKNRKIMKRELNERASRYTHFELKTITFDENKFLWLV